MIVLGSVRLETGILLGAQSTYTDLGHINTIHYQAAASTRPILLIRKIDQDVSLVGRAKKGVCFVLPVYFYSSTFSLTVTSVMPQHARREQGVMV